VNTNYVKATGKKVVEFARILGAIFLKKIEKIGGKSKETAATAIYI
jgi:hypothetical protein